VWHLEAVLSSRWKQSKSLQSDFALNILDAFSQMDTECVRRVKIKDEDQ
jgi:hypothetical protein